MSNKTALSACFWLCAEQEGDGDVLDLVRARNALLERNSVFAPQHEDLGDGGAPAGGLLMASQVA
ncbi:MAG: hypothetical protein ACYDEY_07550 [Acidimicrobiales bacterium]